MSVHEKKVLVIGDNLWEDIDGIRRYSNHVRPRDVAYRAVNHLQREGAHIKLLAPNNKQHSVAQILSAVQASLKGGVPDLVLQLACWPSIQARDVAASKLKVKGQAQLSFDVVGGKDLAAEIKAMCDGVCPLAGYDRAGQWFTQGADNFARALEAVRRVCENAPTPSMLTRIPDGFNLSGRHVVMTSGPTAEKINDAGDVLTNFSTGMQGAAIARALADRGAQVTFISGPAQIPHWQPIDVTHVATAAEMMEAVNKALPADVFIAIAAVADFAPAALLPELAEGKTARLSLKENPDILATIGNLPPGQRPPLVIGFAAENDEAMLEEYALKKLQAKGADAICANPINASVLAGGINDVRFFWREGDAVRQADWDRASKNDIAMLVADAVEDLLALRTNSTA